MTYEVDLVFDGDPHEQGKPILAWVKKHCPSYVKNGGVRYNSGALITFYFTEEQDATWFQLKYFEKLYEE